MRVVVALALGLALTGCGLVKYPGQPGVVTHNYSKVDLEYLEADGLYVYETVYDNRAGGDGVGAIITKLYPNAQTYTSNVRTNADGTLYRAKGAYDGADVQIIAIPKLNQLHVSPHSHVQFFIEQATSLDEVDDLNLAETSLFKPIFRNFISDQAMRFRQFRWEVIKAGRLTPSGNLGYQITGLEMGGKTFTPAAPIKVETSFSLNALRTSLTTDLKADAVRFLEANFPKGYRGPVNLFVKGSTQPMTLTLGIHSIHTAEAAGYKILNNASERLVQEVVSRFTTNLKK